MTPRITRYTVGIQSRKDYTSLIQVEETDCEKGTWAVRRDGFVLNRDFEWEWEPMPSSRDDEFLARCRWQLASALEAASRAWADFQERRTAREKAWAEEDASK